ncbi:hypothetical protein ACJ73_01464 [Blastomyces percursus]|uniref:Uncharacterized protein n=1 Tax=Blastomyces percursus TaxID=1658174 RepID=A0A1J9RGN8_9EURO|nr:hypothetical protein ACJ73_01464 [Blastomyces percursus]
MADILAALDTICNASDASLQKHRDKLGQLLARTASLLGKPDKLGYKPDSNPTCTPSQNSTPIPRVRLLAAHDHQEVRSLPVIDSMDARAEPYVGDGAILQATGCIEEKRIQHVTELLDAIEKKLPKIQKAYENGASNFSYPVSRVEDSRVLDFTICNGTKGKRSMNMRIQRTLSILSLTNEFVAWECLTFEQSKVTCHINVLSEKTEWTGNINKFLNERRIIDKGSARKMISEGTKSIVIQALSGIPGIAALLSTCPRWHEIPYTMLPTLIEGLLDRKMYDDAEAYSDWWESCQENYNNGSRQRKLMIRKCHPSQYPSANRTKRRRIERNEGNHAEGHGDQNYIPEPDGGLSSEFGHSLSQTERTESQIFTTASPPNAICENIAVSQTLEPLEVDKNNPVYQPGVSPYYSGPGGSGAFECHNDSVSKQVRNGQQPSRIRELPFDEQDAARMLQQFQQRVPRCSFEQGGTSVTEPINTNPDSCFDLAPIVDENHERQFPGIASGRISGEPINSRNRIPEHSRSPSPESQSSVEPWASVLFDQSTFRDLGTQHPISEQPTVERWPSVLFDQSTFRDLGTQHPISEQPTVERWPSVLFDQSTFLDLGTQHPISEQPTVERWPSVLFDQSTFLDLGTQHPTFGQSTVGQSPRSVYDNQSLVLPYSPS